MKQQNYLCPICSSRVSIPVNVEITEIITCPDCHTRLVVENINKGEITLGKAPEVEEDWGE